MKCRLGGLPIWITRKGVNSENVATGERVDLIDNKVMASISNPEIRRMELMSTIAGIEKYAASEKHVGMFITITTPSKYHPDPCCWQVC